MCEWYVHVYNLCVIRESAFLLMRNVCIYTWCLQRCTDAYACACTHTFMHANSVLCMLKFDTASIHVGVLAVVHACACICARMHRGTSSCRDHPVGVTPRTNAFSLKPAHVPYEVGKYTYTPARARRMKVYVQKHTIKIKHNLTPGWTSTSLLGLFWQFQASSCHQCFQIIGLLAHPVTVTVTVTLACLIDDLCSHYLWHAPQETWFPRKGCITLGKCCKWTEPCSSCTSTRDKYARTWRAFLC
jgi:hypothetical protein